MRTDSIRPMSGPPWKPAPPMSLLEPGMEREPAAGGGGLREAQAIVDEQEAAARKWVPATRTARPRSATSTLSRAFGPPPSAEQRQNDINAWLADSNNSTLRPVSAPDGDARGHPRHATHRSQVDSAARAGVPSSPRAATFQPRPNSPRFTVRHGTDGHPLEGRRRLAGQRQRAEGSHSTAGPSKREPLDQAACLHVARLRSARGHPPPASGEWQRLSSQQQQLEQHAQAPAGVAAGIAPEARYLAPLAVSLLNDQHFIAGALKRHAAAARATAGRHPGELGDGVIAMQPWRALKRPPMLSNHFLDSYESEAAAASGLPPQPNHRSAGRGPPRTTTTPWVYAASSYTRAAAAEEPAATSAAPPSSPRVASPSDRPPPPRDSPRSLPRDSPRQLWSRPVDVNGPGVAAALALTGTSFTASLLPGGPAALA